MGKINEYQRKQLASTAVGVAPADRSGQIVGGAVSRFGTKLAAEQAVLADQYATVQANTAVMQVGLSLQKLVAQKQREMANDPSAYPESLLKDGQQMVNEFAGGIADQKVRAKFLASANTLLRTGVLAAGDWAIAKQEDNAKTAAEQAIRLGTIATGDTLTKDALVQNLLVMQDMIKEDIPKDLLSTKKVQETIKKDMPKALEAHFSSRVNDDPKALIKDLKEKGPGSYDDIPFFTDAMKKKYIKTAETRINQNTTRINKAQIDNYNVALDQAFTGDLSIADITTLETAPEKENGISAGQAGRLRKAVTLRVESDASRIYDDEVAAQKYIELIRKTYDNRVARAERLDLVVDAFIDGHTTFEENKELSTLLGSLESIQASTKMFTMEGAVEAIAVKTAQLFLPGKGVTENAVALRDLMTQIISGVPVQSATQKALINMEKSKVIKGNTNLAAAEDPVQAAYEAEAISFLRANGYPVDDLNLKAAIAQLKEADNAGKP